ncbi:hypothetical protein DL98DRAFT_2049 [Cadophora sp. DSE1049]|nr:hypothetical protein DL98DRAFT_2049 [Cadophora sp. DSE1049]
MGGRYHGHWATCFIGAWINGCLALGEVGSFTFTGEEGFLGLMHKWGGRGVFFIPVFSMGFLALGNEWLMMCMLGSMNIRTFNVQKWLRMEAWCSLSRFVLTSSCVI